MSETRVLLKYGSDLYYLLKVERRGFDVYCFPPHLGMHYSVHESGEAHFQKESALEAPKSIAVVLMSGEAGTPIGHGILRETLNDLGRASGICNAMYPIESPESDFQKHTRTLTDCFVIDGNLLPGASWVEVGVWAVPRRNEISFCFNVPGIPEGLLYKVPQEEPQIWIYARPIP